MDRGIPTEEVLAEMRAADPPVSYLVGTPKGRLSKLEKHLVTLPWQAVREGVDVKFLPQDQELYVLAHKTALFSHLRQRWQDLFGASFEVLLYDLTSTYFESDPPDDENDKRRYGYSRDKRSDCVQVVIALIVTPDGFPLGYEVLPGNTSDKTTLRDMLQKIEAQYGKANRIWVMDRGIPTEEVLAEMRAADPSPRGSVP